MSLAQCISQMDEGIARVAQVIPELPVVDTTLCRLMLIVGRNLEEELELKLKPHKLNHSEFLTLMILYSRPAGSSTPSELCEFATQSATNMTRIANTLVKRGFISRAINRDDRRRVLIRISAAGRRFVQKMLPPMFPRMSDMFIGFNDADKRRLGQLLRKLADNVDRIGESVTP